MTGMHLPSLFRQGGKFVFVGVANNVAGYTLYLVLTHLGVPPLVAMTASYTLGMVISFTGNRNWTFRHSGSGRTALVRFLLTNALAYTVNFVILAVGTEVLGWNHAWVQLAALAVVATVTFTLMRTWVFAAGSPPATPGPTGSMPPESDPGADSETDGDSWVRQGG